MVPISDDPVTPSQSRDPLRILVHVALAVYLSPVILIVGLIGGLSILAKQTVLLIRRITRKNHPGSEHRPMGLVRSGARTPNSLPMTGRGRSRIAR